MGESQSKLDRIKNQTLKSDSLSVIIYDSDCNLCKDASDFASDFLRKHHIFSSLSMFKSIMGRSVRKGDEFMFVHKGTIYIGPEAWFKILSLGYPWLTRVQKIPGTMFFARIIYFTVSKLRKTVYKKKKGCNC